MKKLSKKQPIFNKEFCEQFVDAFEAIEYPLKVLMENPIMIL